MSTVSKGVADRMMIARTVTRSIDKHARTVAEGASPMLYLEAEASPAKTQALESHLRVLGRALARTTDALRLADLALAGELADDQAPRSDRDAEEAALRAVLMRARNGVRASYGDDALTRVGLAAAFPDTPDSLVLYAQNAARLLADGEAGDALDDAFGLDTQKVARSITNAADRLAHALESVETERREEEEARSARDSALARWQRTYSAVATAFSAMARLADESEIAERVRPTARRRAGLTEPIDEAPDDTENTDPGTDGGTEA